MLDGKSCKMLRIFMGFDSRCQCWVVKAQSCRLFPMRSNCLACLVLTSCRVDVAEVSAPYNCTAIATLGLVLYVTGWCECHMAWETLGLFHGTICLRPISSQQELGRQHAEWACPPHRYDADCTRKQQHPFLAKGSTSAEETLLHHQQTHHSYS